MNQEQKIREVIKNLVEELCAKGKAYRKKRMAAGEKSSAYLSGRAVKVCKGQIKGEGEELEEIDLQYRKGYKDLTGLYKKIVSANDIEEKKKLSHVFVDSLKRISREKRYQHKQTIQRGSASRINDLITNLYMRDNRMTSEDAAMKKSALGMAMYGKKAKMREESATEVNVFGYQTQHFDICPSAYALYKKIVDENLVDDKDLVIRVAKLLDTLFYMEKIAKENPNMVTDSFISIAQNTADLIMSAAVEKMNLEKEHDFVQNHVDIIKNIGKGETVNEIEVKDGTKFKIKLKHLLQKHATNLKRGADDTEFELTLKHLLDKHTVKGGEEKSK